MNMKAISGNEYDTRSKGGYNRVTMQGQQHGFDNKTENFDQNTTKQLQ